MAEILKSKKISNREIVLLKIDNRYLLLGKNCLWSAPASYHDLEEAENNFILLTEERRSKEFRTAKLTLHILKIKKREESEIRKNLKKQRRNIKNEM